MIWPEIRYTDLVLLAGVVAVAWSCWRAHRARSHEFNLFDLLMENGRLSRLACAFMLTLGVSTWIMVRIALDGKMTEGYLIAFGGMWVAPIVAKLFSGNPPADQIDREKKFD
jgi:hypothetical protein